MDDPYLDELLHQFWDIGRGPDLFPPNYNHLDIPERSSGSDVGALPSVCGEDGIAPLEAEISISPVSNTDSSPPPALDISDISGPPKKPSAAESPAAIRPSISRIPPRGRQRPRKAEAKRPKNERPKGRAAIKRRREMHNDSAMRSRGKLNTAIENQFKSIPVEERENEGPAIVYREAKVNHATRYIARLQTVLSRLQTQVEPVNT
jgi:hypothetical protein